MSDYEVFVYKNVNEAIELYGLHKYDLVLSDYDLDDSKDDEFVRYMREN